MKLILARHGETIENNLGILQGQTHGTLNENGIVQAKILAKELEKKEIDFCFSSDLRRAVDTVNILLANRKNISYYQDERLRERYLGDFQGKVIPQNWNSTAEYATAESIECLLDRIKSFLEYLSEYYAEKTILIVSHGITIKAIMSLYLNQDLRAIKTIQNCDMILLNSHGLYL